jgi:hypothetical protein
MKQEFFQIKTKESAFFLTNFVPNSGIPNIKGFHKKQKATFLGCLPGYFT